MDSKDDGQVPKPTEALWHAAAGEEPELVVHSQRPGEPDCSNYLKFGRCRYGSKCMFNHPPKPWAGQWRAGEKQGQQVAEYPRRPGEPDCSHYVKFGSCKFEMNCRFNHPSRKQVVGTFFVLMISSFRNISKGPWVERMLHFIHTKC